MMKDGWHICRRAWCPNWKFRQADLLHHKRKAKAVKPSLIYYQLGFMLCFGQRKYPFLPFVISLFTYAIFFTPAFHSQSTVPAFRDSPGPHGQLGLLIQLLFCAHNKKHPRIADSTRESRILSATIREYCVTLSFCTQAAATFDGYDNTETG